jgi:molecular chaperone Hsp33
VKSSPSSPETMDVGMKDYFSGASPIVSGELGEDFTYYFATSEQTLP